MKKAALIGLFAVIAVMVFSISTARSEDEIAATVNGKNILVKDLDNVLPPNVPAEQKAEARKQVLERLVEERLLTEFINSKDIKIDKADFERRIAQIRDGLSLQLKLEKYLDEVITEKVVKDEFDKNVKARHILVKIDADTDEKAAKEKIDTVEKELKTGADFAELAKKYSDCPSGKQGGELGTFTADKMVKEFSDTAFGLKPGETSKPVKTQFGWHLIQRQELSLEEIKSDLSRKIKMQMFEDILKGLKEKAKIEMKLQ